MEIDHNSLVYIAKSYGLVYFVILSLGIAIYAYWPSNKKPFESVANSILDDEEDKPCQ